MNIKIRNGIELKAEGGLIVEFSTGSTENITLGSNRKYRPVGRFLSS